MSTITAVKPHPKKEGQGFVKLDDDTEAWTPEFAKVEPFVGKLIPEGWELKDGPYGKQLLPPKQRGGGGQSAWRNTKEGAEFEAANWRHKQAVEQERMDRRTALMQAVACYTATDSALGSERIMEKADQFYTWLRDGSGSASQPPSPGASRPEHSPGATDVRVGEGAAAPSQGNGAGEGPQGPEPAPQSSEAVSRNSPAADGMASGGSETTGSASDSLTALRNHALRLYSPAELRSEAFGFYHKDLRVQDLTAEQLAELIEAREKAGALT